MRLVLLVEPDVDELGSLASKLRAHGLEVAIADSLDGAVERASQARVSALLLSNVIVAAPDFAEQIAARQLVFGAPIRRRSRSACTRSGARFRSRQAAISAAI